MTEILAIVGITLLSSAAILWFSHKLVGHMTRGVELPRPRTSTSCTTHRPDFALQYHDNRTVTVMHTNGKATRMDAETLRWAADEMRKYATAIETMDIVLDTHEVQAEEQLPAKADEHVAKPELPKIHPAYPPAYMTREEKDRWAREMMDIDRGMRIAEEVLSGQRPGLVVRGHGTQRADRHGQHAG